MKITNTLFTFLFVIYSFIFFSCSVNNFFYEDTPNILEIENSNFFKIDEPSDKRLKQINEIVDPDNILWPRIININDKEIIIEERPKRILTISLGHDEILFGISNKNQIVGTTSYAQEKGSNIKNLATGLPIVTIDPESIIALDPDIVFADAFASVDLIDTLEDLDIKVIQTKLNNSIDGRKKDILLMSYITGNLSEGSKLIKLIDNNIKALENLSHKNNATSKKVLPLSWWDSYWTAGKGSTEDSVISLTGAINLASENGIESNVTIDKELLISMNPDIILITQSIEWGGKDFYDQLFDDHTLSNLQAIKNQEVYIVNPNWWSTLSYWNIKGSEELAKILWKHDEIDGFGDFN